MRKWQRVLLILVIPFLWVATAFLLARTPRTPKVTLTSLARLNSGMSEAEVAAALGPPTEDVTGRAPPDFTPAAPGGRLFMYVGERATATVEFGEDGRLVRHRVVIWAVNLEERIRLRLNWW